ncbi:MAG: hypothetical protein NW226_17365 [Microscillaceae bacterium]|nr:hypothetical protein [Microscillaceae bacterium]
MSKSKFESIYAEKFKGYELSKESLLNLVGSGCGSAPNTGPGTSGNGDAPGDTTGGGETACWGELGYGGLCGFVKDIAPVT